MSSGNSMHDTVFTLACDQARAKRSSRDWLYKDDTLRIGVGSGDVGENLIVIVKLYGATPQQFETWRAICKAEAAPGKFGHMSRFEGEYRLWFIPK